MPKREFDLTERDAAFLEQCLAGGDWTDADEVIQAALTLLRTHDFGPDGAKWAAYEQLLIDEADESIAREGVIEIPDIEAYTRGILNRVLAKHNNAA